MIEKSVTLLISHKTELIFHNCPVINIHVLVLDLTSPQSLLVGTVLLELQLAERH